MSDLFHEEIQIEFILRAFQTMVRVDWRQYELLTKCSRRLLELSPLLPWACHIWMGVGVEDEDYTFRIDDLRNTDARIKFLSIEPLLGPLPNLDLNGSDWVIVGGESGPKASMARAWVRDIRDQCQAACVPFFFKQWGGRNKKKAGRVLDGRTWNEMPAQTSGFQFRVTNRAYRNGVIQGM